MGKLGRNLVRAAKGPQAVEDQKKGAMDRITDLEDFREGVLRAMRQTFGVIEQRIATINDMMVALTNLVGQENVEKEVQRLEIERSELRSAKEKAGLDAAIARGELVPAEEVGDLSVVIGTETDKDGKPLHPVRVQFLYATMKQSLKESFTGVKVGAAIDMPAGTKFTVSEVWNVVPGAERQAPPVESTPPATEAAPQEELTEEPVDEKVEAQLVEELTESLN